MAHRIFLPLALSGESSVTLEGAPFRHLIQVLRLSPGDEFVAFDGSGSDFPASLVEVGKRAATVRLHAPVANCSESPLQTVLVQALGKGDRVDNAVQKAVELGVNRVIPFIAERGVVKVDDKRRAKKQAHWQGIVIAACEQSGRAAIPTVEAIQRSLADALAMHDGDTLFLDPHEGNAIADLAPPRGPVAVLIGPEGGFTQAERDQAVQVGAQPLRVGPRILRMETAGPTVLALLQARFGDF